MKTKVHLLISLLFFSMMMILIITACDEEEEPTYPDRTRAESIPEDAVKITPETDVYPPIMHSAEYEQPVPLGTPVNTAGAEDSPFIPADRAELYIFFTPDVSIPAEQQLTDSVTGIYVSRFYNDAWQEPERVWLQDPGKLALDGAEWVEGNNMLFASAREGYSGLHWFSAEFLGGRWTNWQNADFSEAYEVGELHIHDNALYYHSSCDGGSGQLDIWKLTLVNGEWQNPENVTAVNSAENEGWPYITPDGNELWFTRTYMGSPGIFRSIKLNDDWQDPELMISQFAGEPTLDSQGNVFFTHHFYKDNVMLEADIYVAYKK
jgi:hypothetical protein